MTSIIFLYIYVFSFENFKWKKEFAPVGISIFISEPISAYPCCRRTSVTVPMHMHVQCGATSSKFEVMHDDIVAGAAVEGPMHYNRPLSQYHDAAPGCFPIIIITFILCNPIWNTHIRVWNWKRAHKIQKTKFTIRISIIRRYKGR